jgi:hypothetical protein
MEATIETIVSKLRHLSADKLQVILEFVNFLVWQEPHTVSSAGFEPAVELQEMTKSDRHADWKAFINECSGASPDFPLVEEIRADMGEGVALERV